MKIESIFHDATSTLTYLVSDEETRDALVIDAVLDYDAQESVVSTDSVDALAARIREQGLRLLYILDTHVHADHMTGSEALKKHFPDARVAIGARITDVQKLFGQVFALEDSFAPDGRQFDLLLADGETLKAGNLEVEVMHTPGHTPACASYKIEDAVFTGDALFMPDFGTGRCDFPAGSAEMLYESINRLYQLPDETRVFVGHDYQPGGRELEYETTIGKSKRSNKHVRTDTSREEFVSFRRERDATLKAPKLLFPSLQVNIRAGALPAADKEGRRFLKVPLRSKQG